MLQYYVRIDPFVLGRWRTRSWTTRRRMRQACHVGLGGVLLQSSTSSMYQLWLKHTRASDSQRQIDFWTKTKRPSIFLNFLPPPAASREGVSDGTELSHQTHAGLLHGRQEKSASAEAQTAAQLVPHCSSRSETARQHGRAAQVTSRGLASLLSRSPGRCQRGVRLDLICSLSRAGG